MLTRVVIFDILLDGLDYWVSRPSSLSLLGNHDDPVEQASRGGLLSDLKSALRNTWDRSREGHPA